MTLATHRAVRAAAAALASRFRVLAALYVAMLCATFAPGDAAAQQAFPLFGDWTAPNNLGSVDCTERVPPTEPVNSSDEESGPAISDDSRSLYFNRNPNSQGDVDEDLLVSHRARPGDPWCAPVPLVTINTPTFHERNAALSSNERLLFFSSDRNVDGAGNPVGLGGLDLYYSRRAKGTGDSGWSAPVNLGPDVNGPLQEVGPAFLENESGVAALYFTSTRRGNADIYRSVVTFAADGSPSVGPPSFVAELNSATEDARPALRKDGLEVIFHSRRPPSLGRDLWVSTRATVLDPWSSPIQLSTVNSSDNDLQATLSDDGETLFFSSNRSGGLGQDDIWISERDR
jgi:WD40-like Beta Propeller Repeat